MKVSIIIPAYNQAQYLRQAIRSALEQTYSSLEVIVVDDGSTDRTAQVAQGFNDHRLHYIHQNNRGLAGARNTGIRMAHGECLSFLDSDDLFLPEKLAVLTEVLRESPEIGFVAGQAIPIDPEGRRIGKVFDRGIPEDASQLLLWNPLHVGSVLVRRAWLEKAGYFDESLRSYEDWDLWLRLMLSGCKPAWVPRPVSLYRVHPEQMTRDGAQMTTATFAVLDKLFARPDLPKRWSRLKDQAYSNAHLRAAAQAYMSGAYSQAKASLGEAVRLDPRLAADGADQLSRRIAAWSDDARLTDPLGFLERIYNNLPTRLEPLFRRRRQDLSRAAMQRAYEAHNRGDPRSARQAVVRAFRYQPRWLGDRGALSIFFQSLLRPQPTGRTSTD